MKSKEKISPSFQWYLTHQFEPAQVWSKSPEGKRYISEHCPSLASLIDTDYNTCLFAVYAVLLNNRCVYIGESIRTVRRLVVHLWNICTNPHWFGLKPDEDVNIEVKLLSTWLFNSKLRKDEELFWIEQFSPVLQECDGTDRCISRSKRRNALIHEGVISA